jgi:hypothetical protein
MKFVKYLAVLTVVLCAFASNSHAQTIQFLGGGSSALFNELGQAAATSALTNTPCVWTQKKNAAVLAQDNRTGPATTEQGNIWITWSAGTGTCAAPAGNFNVYSYMSLDSVIGDRCYFATDAAGVTGCQQVITIAANTAGVNLLPGVTDTAGGIPAAVIAALNGQHFFAVGTDVRPEDAKFASLRMFTPCGTPVNRQPFDQGLRQTYGLGYQTGVVGVGTTVQSSFSTATFHVLDFNVTGNDPISGKPVPTYSVNTVGAQPIVVTAAPFNPTGGNTGLSAASDINGFTLTLFYQGVLGRSTDLFGPTVTNAVTTLVREPLSGTYNTFEFSTPNSSQFHGSQDDNNCNGNVVFANPMTLQSTNGVFPAFRKRVIGTGEMTSTLQAATTDTLGYFFWSSGNASGLTNVKYLTVDGVDPIQTTYTGGILPGNSGVPLANVTFKNLNAGDYSIWSALRIVTKAAVPAGVTNLITAAQTAAVTASDMITLANLKVWHSHYYLPAINIGVSANGNTISAPNDLCNSVGALGEFGGDAGGANVLKQANLDFCSDFGNINGLINKAN